MTTPGDPRSIRKLDNASKVDGSVRTESCNHEEGTMFYATIGWDQSTQTHRIQSPPSLVKIVPYMYGHGSTKKGVAMKLASIKPNELAVVKDDTWIAVGETLIRQGALPTDFSMLDLIEKYPSLKSSLAEALDRGNARKIDAKLLKPPVERPSKIWAAAGNYRRGSEGLGDARGRGSAFRASPEELLET